MRQKIIALLLVLVLVSTIVVSAFAAEDTANTSEAAQGTEEVTETGKEDVAGTPISEEDTKDGAVKVLEEELPEATADMILFQDLENLVKKNNLSYRSLGENASYMSELEDTIDDLETGIAKLDEALTNPELDEEERASLTAQRTQMQQTLSTMSSSLQQDPDVVARQMDAGQDQLILGCQTIYIALVGMEQQEGALQRQLAALDRTVKEMKLRAEMGQISELQLMEVESGRASLVSGLTTLRMNISNYKMQLEQMIGEEVTGTVKLGVLPTVTDEELNAINAEEDLKLVRRRNYDIYAASAAETSAYEMADKYPGMDSDMLDHMQNAAYYTYKDTYQQVELKFKMLYAQLQDCRQIVTAAESTLKCEELAYQAEELKYQQGTISHNALLTAEDELKTAQEAVRTAKNDLFSTYNNYCWAVQHGILN